MSSEGLSTSTLNPTSTTLPAAARKASLYRRAVLRALSGMKKGHLRLEMPDNTCVEWGLRPQTAVQRLPLDIPGSATVRVRREVFFRKCILAGDIGFAESYIDGDWETPDLTAVIAWFVLNHDTAPTLSGSARKRAQSGLINIMRFANRVIHLLQPNSREIARKNIARHYDLSNEFFSLFLDPSMMYSAGKWVRADQTLEEAQFEKNDALCRHLRLSASDHVLEIGTGWGGWALQAAQQYGCRVTTVTISKQQFAYARRRIEQAGLTDKVDVRLQDYRELTGQFDKIVSIEMMEAIGHAYLPEFCERLQQLLKPSGLLALQFITYPDHRYSELRSGVDFIQKHIFPGSLLLSLNRVNQLLSEQGGFVLHALDDLGQDYARTLRLWREQFHQRLDQVRALGFDDRFVRKWDYYLCYCEAAFALRNISVVQTLHTRPNNLAF